MRKELFFLFGLELLIGNGCADYVPSSADQRGIITREYERQNGRYLITETYGFGHLVERRIECVGQLIVQNFEHDDNIYDDVFEGNTMTRIWYDSNGDVVNTSIMELSK